MKKTENEWIEENNVFEVVVVCRLPTMAVRSLNGMKCSSNQPSEWHAKESDFYFYCVRFDFWHDSLAVTPKSANADKNTASRSQ